MVARAKQYLPEAKGCTMWLEDTCQLVCGSYATGDGEVTFSARAMVAGVQVAVVEVLSKSWRHHEDAAGEDPLF